MYLPIEPQESCALAWLAAIAKVNAQEGHEARNVIINVRDPVSASPIDRAIISAVDGMLTSHGAWPVQTVANTIFPQSLYRRSARDKPSFSAPRRDHARQLLRRCLDHKRTRSGALHRRRSF